MRVGVWMGDGEGEGDGGVVSGGGEQLWPCGPTAVVSEPRRERQENEGMQEVMGSNSGNGSSKAARAAAAAAATVPPLVWRRPAGPGLGCTPWRSCRW